MFFFLSHLDILEVAQPFHQQRHHTGPTSYNSPMNRRNFLQSAGGFLLGLAGQGVSPAPANKTESGPVADAKKLVTLFFGGDVMTGRGIDQVLPHPSDPVLHESYVKSATGYVELAEEVSGPIPKPVSFDYIWGDALGVLEAMRPDARIINLETSITTSDEHWQHKGINYRMHPDNVPCLTAAGIDCCALANNHTLDWSYPGLAETLNTLHDAGILTAGAGNDLQEACKPAVIELPDKGRVLVFSLAVRSSGTLRSWAAKDDKAGIIELSDLTRHRTQPIIDRIRAEKQPGDIVVASIHWGGNWGYFVSPDQREFAHKLVDAGVDVIHGHSSHHAKGIEVINNRPVIYGCGDLINDYEGIGGGNDRYRGELPLLYFVTLDAATGELHRFEMKPMRIRKFRLNHASVEESEWLREVVHRQGQTFNTAVTVTEEQFLKLGWDASRQT